MRRTITIVYDDQDGFVPQSSMLEELSMVLTQSSYLRGNVLALRYRQAGETVEWVPWQ